MSDPVYVIESISDGDTGYPYDEILSIAVCKVDLDGGDFETVFDGTVRVEPKYVGKAKLDYAESKGFDVMSLYDGTPLKDLVEKFHEVVEGQYVAAYDARQQFTRYLCNDPWDITGMCHIMPSISARQPISLRCKDPEDEPDIIVKAYRKAFRDDSLKAGRNRGAIELAQMASMVAVSLRARGKYRFTCG